MKSQNEGIDQSTRMIGTLLLRSRSGCMNKSLGPSGAPKYGHAMKENTLGRSRRGEASKGIRSGILSPQIIHGRAFRCVRSEAVVNQSWR